MIWIAIALVVVVGPLLLGAAGFMRQRREVAPDVAPVEWNWKLTVVSALIYTLAYNLTFFIQEVFLVVPKAFTPGLEPTLFHNNHSWEGDHPLASLFQGTGALATFITGSACALFLRRYTGGPSTLRLFILWMAYHGLLQSLPQVVIGALNPGNDVGMAMEYFGLGSTTKLVLALLVLAAIPPLAIWLMQRLLSLADDVLHLATPGARTRFVFLAGTLPALASVPLIVSFRVPREWFEVWFPPVLVTVIGMAWMQAGAWRVRGVKFEHAEPVGSVTYPLVAVVALLLVFQLVLRPGIHF